MKNLKLPFLIITLLFALSQSNAQDNSPDLFDFWVGNWKVTWDEADGKKGRGINRITKEQNDNVIHEDFQILEGLQKGFKGASISVFHNKENTWKQAWADSNGDFFYFKGKSDGAKRIFQTDIKIIQDNKEFTQRMVFYDIKENSMMWDWESSVDGGKTWTLNWRINYERVL